MAMAEMLTDMPVIIQIILKLFQVLNLNTFAKLLPLLYFIIAHNIIYKFKFFDELREFM